MAQVVAGPTFPLLSPQPGAAVVMAEGDPHKY